MKIKEVAEQPSQQTDDTSVEELKKLLGQSYPNFVTRLKQHINDKKFINAIKFVMAKGSRVNPTGISVPVSKARPTQNEIGVVNSLAYPLTDPNTMISYLKGGTVRPNNADIVTADKGKYIIDGHHRWSQVFVINPRAKISAIDASDISSPMDALKATQLGILSATGDVPSATINSSSGNLLTIDQKSLINYVKEKMTDEVLTAIQTLWKSRNITRDMVAEYIWKNVSFMQQNNEPVSGAPTRDLMPQTDVAKGLGALNNAPNPEEPPLAETVFRIIKLSGLK